MKTKFSKIYMFVCTLALCAGVAMFGVYSALSASLNISTKLGFDMQNAVVEIFGQVKNIAQPDSQAGFIKVSRPIQSIVMGSQAGTLQSDLPLDDLYFYKGLDEVSGTAKVLDIVFELTITNLDYDNRMVLNIADTSSSLPENVQIATDNYYTTLPYTTYFDASQSKTISIALRLTNEEAILNSLSFDLDMSFAVTTSTTPSYFAYEGDLGWYLTMGTNPYSGYNEPLKWMPFATNNSTSSSTTMSYFDNKTVEPILNHTYYFIAQESLQATELSSYMYYNYNGTDNTNYKSAYYNGSSWVNLSSIYVNDYSVSNMRAYLTNSRPAYYDYSYNTGGGVTEVTPFKEQFSIEDTNKIYKKIIARSQSDLYASMGGTTILTALTYTATTINGVSTNTSDHFWQPSCYEIYAYMKNNNTVTNPLSSGYYTLRTPESGTKYMSYFCFDGEFVSLTSCSDAGGVRPCFTLKASV